jgi:hypothetical protein
MNNALLNRMEMVNFECHRESPEHDEGPKSKLLFSLSTPPVGNLTKV